MKSKKGERDALVLQVLQERGRPGTVHDIERMLPEEFRLSKLDTTRTSCRKLWREKKLKRWGGPKHKKFWVYGLLEHTKPPDDEIPPTMTDARKWVRGFMRGGQG